MKITRTLSLSLLGAVLCASAFAAGAPAPEQRIHTKDGRALTAASADATEVVIERFVQARGGQAAGLDVREIGFDADEGLRFYRGRQVVAGFPVFGPESKFAVNARGQIVHAIDATVRHDGRVAPAAIDKRQALDAAIAHLYGDDAPVMYRTGVDPVAVPTGRSLAAGFVAEVWTQEDNLLYHVLVDGRGNVLGTQLRTASENYAIFPDNPDATPQVTVAGPGSTTESPNGWLFTDQDHRDIHIQGNNANAYLDTTDSNSPDPGGNVVADGDFTTPADLGQQPTTAQNQAVAVQNLFYLNNVIHDKLYEHGFVESTRNFQEDNFGRGGIGGDSVLAEAQDGSGTDNANFSTPSDGSNPRMQMYLWSGLGDHIVVNDGNTYLAMGAEFGPALDETGVTAAVVEVDDGSGTTTDACEAFTQTALQGAIALIDRGTCDFATKVGNAEAAGAIGAIVANNAGEDILTMGGTASIGIGSVFVGQSDGAAIRTNGGTTTISANPNQPLMKDGDLDSDIVYHEYGHGLTWRMIGNMSGPMSGAIGEGMSDVVAILMNGRDTVGSYSAGTSAGIRSAPYTGYESYRTYGDFDGSSVHFDGEIYAAAVWKVWGLYDAAGISKDLLWDDIVGGMNFTPSGPAMEDMRDGILQQAPADRDCYIWHGFAALGIGEGASSKVKGGGPFGGGNVSVTESFTIPSEFAGGCGGGTSNQAPTAGFSTSVNDLTVDFTDASTDSDGTIAGWSWSFGDGNTSTAQNPSHTYAADGTYTVTLTVTDDDGADDSTSQSVTVSSSTGNAAPTASFGTAISDLTVDFTDASTDSDGTIASWSWDFGDGNGSTAQNPSHTYAAGGTYTVTLTVTDDGGLSDSASQDVTVTAPPTGGISLSAAGYKVRGRHHIDYSWTGASSTDVDVYRNGNLVATTPNDGAFTENTGNTGGAVYTVEVCEAGTSTCSNTVQVVF